MKVALIVAMAKNGVIGRNNALPWHLPEDLRYFKKVTLGKPVIMGRKTFESIGRPLPGRTNIVVSSGQINLPEGVRLAHSVDEALKLAESIALIDGVDEIMVIGGQQIYSLFMPKVDRVYLTRVHADVQGDAYFTHFNEVDYQLVDKVDYFSSETNPYDYSFCVFDRKNKV